MSDPKRFEDSNKQVSIESWIESKKHDPHAFLERQATEILIHALSTPPFEKKVFLKGGILLGIIYNSPRQTADIDFTTSYRPDELRHDVFRNQLNHILSTLPNILGYPDIVMRVQSIKEQPKIFSEASFPSLKFKIGYARRGTPQEKSVLAGNCSDVLEADLSFNEIVEEVQIVHVVESRKNIYAYSVYDVIAEKIRAFLQQEHRKRERRQDIYDLALLIDRIEFSSDEKKLILKMVIEKCGSRNLLVDVDSIRNEKLAARAIKNWHTLEIDLGYKPPPFYELYEEVCIFYESLPWESGGVG